MAGWTAAECLPLAAGLCAVTTAAAVHFQFHPIDITLCISQITDFLFDERGRWHAQMNKMFCFVVLNCKMTEGK